VPNDDDDDDDEDDCMILIMMTVTLMMKNKNYVRFEVATALTVMKITVVWVVMHVV